MLDKKAESWSSFIRYSLSPNKNFILFVRVYFTAIHVLSGADPGGGGGWIGWLATPGLFKVENIKGNKV